MRWSVVIVILLSVCAACTAIVARPDGGTNENGEGELQRATTGAPAARPETRPAAAAPGAAASGVDTAVGGVFARYSWLEAPPEGMPAPVDTLDRRFPEAPGFSRVPLPKDGFGAFLRALPLAARGTPVLSYGGAVVRGADHPNVAAVVAIDVGDRDLQQCADAVIRLHAEWRFARGGRDQAYRAASGTRLSFARYTAGERIQVDGNRLLLVPSARPKSPTHELFRVWLDDVFGWANTGALARDGERVPLEALKPGDFFVVTGSPYGHTVLVLDMAKDAKGRRALLLGQSFVPAQNFHVLRPGPESAWFVVDDDAGAITTPFWTPFPFDSLRRLPE